MRALILVSLTLLGACASAAEPCQTFRGRARTYSGDGWIDIWRVGTHHTYHPVKDSSKLIEDYVGWHDDKEVFGYFTVCPTEPFREGASQPVVLKSIAHPQVKKRTE